MQQARPALPAIIAVFALGVLSLIGGWLIVYGGGFFHSPGRHASDAAFYSGTPALLMAGLQYLTAALAFTWLLRAFVSLVLAGALAFTVVFGPPAAYMFLSI